MATTHYNPIPCRTGKSVKYTIRNVINYYENPKKTQNKKLVTGLNCNPETAIEEMNFLHELYHKVTGRESNQQTQKRTGAVMYHTRQSFHPNEKITPQEAHNLAISLAQKILGTEYENFQIVVTTHVDQKHIHSDIAWNAVGFDLRKYNSKIYMYKRVRQLSDCLCREHDLSVIEHPGKTKSPGYTKGKNVSYRNTIKNDIDGLIQKSKSFDDLLLKLSKIYTIDQRGKYITLLHKTNGQLRPIRLYSCGTFYAETMLEHRIKQNRVFRNRRRRLTRQQKLMAQIYKKHGFVTKAQAMLDIRAMENLMRCMSSYNAHSLSALEQKLADASEQLTSAKQKMNQFNIVQTARKAVEQNSAKLNPALLDHARQLATAASPEEISRLQLNLQTVSQQLDNLSNAVFTLRRLKEGSKFLTPYQKTKEEKQYDSRR